MKFLNKILIVIILNILLLSIGFSAVSAQENNNQIIEGVVEDLQQGHRIVAGNDVEYQDLSVKIDSQFIPLVGEYIQVQNGGIVMMQQEFAIGDHIRINVGKDNQGNNIFQVLGFVRRNTLFVLFLLFVIVVIVVGKKWGVMSLISMGLSFLIIYKWVLPSIMAGSNPILIVILASIIIIPLTFYVSHGFNLKTHVGVISTFMGLIFTGLLAKIFIVATHLTGFSNDESNFLHIQRSGSIDIIGLLLAGIIIGTLGVMDDITIGQSSLISQLKKTNPMLSARALYIKGMEVGQDHISSMVNTLVLVYAGSAFPLLLMFVGSNRSLAEVFEFEIITEEVVRMLVGSIGLVMIAPIATFIASIVFSRWGNNIVEG